MYYNCLTTFSGQKPFVVQHLQVRICLDSPIPELQIVIFTKIGGETNSLTKKGVEVLVNSVIREFGLNPHSTIWIEDDQSLANLIEHTLLKQHYQVDLADDGQKGFNLAEVVPYELILLDWNLPKLDGFQFCQQLRKDRTSSLGVNCNTPIILMTALDEVTNKVLGLDAGADDYLVKPFEMEELLARIRALLRRNTGRRAPILTWGELALAPHNCRVTFRGQEIALTSKEYELLEIFLRNPEQIFSISRLLDALWNFDNPPSEGAVRTHMKGLRHKLRKAGVPEMFETTYKLGYKLTSPKINPQEAQSEQTKEENLGYSFVLPEIAQLWDKYRDSYLQQVEHLQQMVTALEKGTLTSEQQEQAKKEAHTMLGSLGSFGLQKASCLAGQIDKILRFNQPLENDNAQELERLVQDLQNQISTYSHSTKSPIESFSISDKPNNHLLIVEPDLNLAQQIAVEGMLRGFETQIALDLPQARELLKDGCFEVLLLELNFSESIENGLTFLASIKETYPKLLVIILTIDDSLHTKVQASRLGIQSFLQKPIAPTQIITSVIDVSQQNELSPFRLLVVDDDDAILDAVSSILKLHNYEVITLNDPEKFWESLEQNVPDLLILDVELYPGYPSRNLHLKEAPLSGFDLCQIIRNDVRWNRLPILFLSAYTDPQIIQHGFTVGADDFLHKPINSTELVNRIRTRLNRHKVWQVLEKDELTGVSLRYQMLQDLVKLIHLAQRQQEPLSLALLDLDHFKKVNDQYGHEMGDRVLNYLGQLLTQSFRKEDVIGRWGGEEFLIAMYHTTKEDGVKRVEQILYLLSQHQFTTNDGIMFSVKFSAGVVQFPQDGRDSQSLYRAADHLLYQAKTKGGNCVLTTGQVV